MANKISIGIHVNNKASRPLKDVGKQIQNLRQRLVRFNRNMFTAGALFATFGAGFRKAMDLSKIGAQFGFVREKFMSTFGPKYLSNLQKASRGTVDALSLMQTSLQGYTAGLSKSEITQAATIAAGAAKIMGQDGATHFKKLTKALYTNNAAAFQNYMVNLRSKDSFDILNKVIDQTTKGLGSAGLKFEVFRKMALKNASAAMIQYLDASEDSLDIMLRTAVVFKDLKGVVGEFIARALAPLAKIVAIRVSGAFSTLFTILNSTSKKFSSIKGGLIDFIQILGVAGGGLIAGFGGLSLLNLFLGTLGISFSTFASVIGLAAIALKSFKGENESWLQFMGKIGTAMKFVVQAFMSYRDGAVTITGEVHDRFLMLSKGTQNFIMRISKLAVQTKIFLSGMRDGFMGIVDAIGSAVSGLRDLLGLTGPAMKFSQKTADSLGSKGKLAGAGVTGLIGLFATKKILGGIGSLVTGGIGRKGSAANPMWVRMTNLAGMATAFGGKLGFLKKSVLGMTALAGLAIGKNFDEQTGASDWIAKKAMGILHPDKPSTLGFMNQARSSKTKFTGVDDDLKGQFMSSMEKYTPADKQHLFPTKMLERAMLDNNVTSREIAAIMERIEYNTKRELDNLKPINNRGFK